MTQTGAVLLGTLIGAMGGWVGAWISVRGENRRSLRRLALEAALREWDRHSSEAKERKQESRVPSLVTYFQFYARAMDLIDCKKLNAATIRELYEELISGQKGIPDINKMRQGVDGGE